MMYIIFWFLSIILSVKLDNNLKYMIIKDLADEGYLLKMGNNNNNNNNENNFNYYFTKVITFIPFINIMKSLFLNLSYQLNKSNTFYSFYIYNELEIMTPLEKNTYQKNPTAFTALFLKFIVLNRLLKAGCIYIHDDIGFNNDIGRAYFEYDDAKKDIHIIERQGCAKRFSEVAIKNLLDKADIKDVENSKEIHIHMKDLYSNDKNNTSRFNSRNEESKCTYDSIIDNTCYKSLENEPPYVYKKIRK